MTDGLERMLFGVATFVAGAFLSALFILLVLLPGQNEHPHDHGYLCRPVDGEWFCRDVMEIRGAEPRPKQSPTEVPKPPPADDAHRAVSDVCILCHITEDVIR